MNITILGSGSWGSALAKVLSDNQHQVTIWGIDPHVVDEINHQHTNSHYLKDFKLNDEIKATGNLEEAVAKADVILFAVPTQAIRKVAQQINILLVKKEAKPLIIHVSKGLEQSSHLRISQVIQESIDPAFYKGIVVLSGPSHAEEVAREDLTTVTAASDFLALAEIVQDLFMNHYFRVYTNTDVIGVELGAALKNIIALGAGILHGLGYGDNAKAALITRGLAEISRLGVRLGADPLTFLGLSGVGDLIVTCTSPHSRNWQAGNLLAKGLTVQEVTEEVQMVVEGIFTCRAAYELSQQYRVEMPITNGLYQVLYQGADVKEEVVQLMTRSGKQEASLAQHNENVNAEKGK
ncbi:NAD(P)H-dependent glycerol-3-phosphate dehydrogenase [Facklamia miroungae]|uniref:Glycerol-3-phosphate dehydrogenase [NAD(P)+] n=1 Tax=Facklamia miroungae TaxID=120956 RepID=A0A1G7RR96_9LACT|nr:NAD(P)H-dependent glycerol-3-phosphate dehydrogenase [Facklamia miroungae]NKZ29307.1 NAD(P)H-dependent glycerol-3-phosphate dehydrogenase [Facklamia miroungae]SDG13328.1 glycerol-3-phosphate dehydrogenase (NAD(P)+) [Facklamia miroungae]